MQRPQDAAAERLEGALTALVREVLSVHLDDNGTPVERTAYALLASLREDGPQRLSTLAEVVRLDRSTVSRQLATLEQRGLVERRPDGHDRRSHLLALTEDGQQVLNPAVGTLRYVTTYGHAHWHFMRFMRYELAGLDVHAAVAANLWPELSNDTEPSPSLAQAVERGSLRTIDAVSVVARRDRVLSALRGLR